MHENATIAILPADREDRRLRLTMLSKSTDGGALRLIDETYSEAVGWFAQGHIDLSPEQISDLRMALGSPKPVRTARSAQRTAAGSLGSGPLLTVHRAG